MDADVQPGMVFLPPTSDFPPDPEPLERDALNSTYLELRNCYSSLMRSRAQHRRLANKAKDETALLKERITALASRDLPQRKELYELLEIVTAIAGDIEDAGDDLVNGFSRYKKGRHTFQGGGYLGDLMRAVIHFINRWGRTKDRIGDLKQKHQQLIDKSKDLLGTPLPPPGGNRRVLNTLRYIHANPKAAGVRKGFYDPYSNYGHYGRLECDGITEWHPSFLQLAPTLKRCSKRYERFCQRYRQHAKGAAKCHWGSRVLKRLVETRGAQTSKKKRVSPGRHLPFACDVRLNQIPDEWHQIAVRFRRANGFSDGDRERSVC